MKQVISYGKHGFLNESGEVIVPCIYLEIKRFSDRNMAVKNEDGLWGLLADDGSVMIECKYDGIEEWKEQQRLYVKRGGRYALADYHGNELTGFIFDWYSWPMENRKSVCVDGKWGVINSDGTFVIEAKYESISPERNGCFEYKENGKYGMLKPNGDVLFDNVYDSFHFSADPNLFVAKKNGKYGCIDFSGTEILPFEYDEVTVFEHADLIEVIKNDKVELHNKTVKVGLYNKKGIEIAPCVYDDSEKLLDMPQFMKVKRSRKGWGLYAADGTELLPAEYQEISNLTFENGSRVGTACIPFSIKKKGKYGLYDPFERKIVEECIHDERLI